MRIRGKKPAKDQREQWVLLGLVELYLQTGKPIGSNTLMENGFETLSSATIRNYFGRLEEGGLVMQQHSSGGRIPTEEAFRLYAAAHLKEPLLGAGEREELRKKLLKETRELASYLQMAAEEVSALSGCAVFLSSPRFDNDFILEAKLMSLDRQRLLCVLLTDFGVVRTEILHTENKLSSFTVKRIEKYFNARLSGQPISELDQEEEQVAAQLYKEILLRHVVSYANFSAEDLYKTGFARLLNYPDFNGAASLAYGLSLFENEAHLRAILGRSCKNHGLSCFIGADLEPIVAAGCSVISIPYRIRGRIVGAIGLLGPNRLPYRHLFGLLEAAAETIGETLTRSMYKYKITYREPSVALLENKSTEEDL